MAGEKMTDADLGYPAWRGFIAWAYDQPEMREQFTAAAEANRPALRISRLTQ